MTPVKRIEVVDPMHPVWVRGVLTYPMNGRGVIDENGTLYCTDQDAPEAHVKYGATT